MSASGLGLTAVAGLQGRARVAWIAAILAPVAVVAEPVRSGHATAELLAAAGGYCPGGELVAGVRLSVDDGWHTYWVNPGEGGMKPTVEWRLPDGWTAGELMFPVPRRFMTGELPGFGYAGTVVLPVVLRAPRDAAGKVTIAAGFSWLTCSDSGCVPGSAELRLALEPAADPGAGTDAAAEGPLRAALGEVPRPLAGAVLRLVADGDQRRLELALPAGIRFDPAACEVFPATGDVVDPAVRIRFARAGDRWRATVRKSEYAAGPPTELALVLAGGGLPFPVLLQWRADAR